MATDPRPAAGEGTAVFLQPFSLSAVGGGTRILQSVLADAPMRAYSICTYSAGGTKRSDTIVPETVLPLRPYFGRIERTRFAGTLNVVEPVFAVPFRRKLRALLQELRPDVLHILPHARGDYAEVGRVANELGLPYVVSIHDDLAYTMRGHPRNKQLLGELGRLWREAASRLVITEAMGREYCRRYGERTFKIHTDGRVPAPVSRPSISRDRPVTVYFMGLCHHAYEPNFRTLIEAMAALRSEYPQLRLKMRTDGHPLHGNALPEWAELLPFAGEDVVRRDLESADILFLPLPLATEQQSFTRFSLSTKSVAYLATGLPILFLGPEDSALWDYLRRRDAAELVTASGPAALAAALRQLLVDADRRDSLQANTLAACREDFDPARLVRVFWEQLAGAQRTRRPT
jgi:glycosyltransferase involved in cell wall biosynthesis